MVNTKQPMGRQTQTSTRRLASEISVALVPDFLRSFLPFAAVSAKTKKREIADFYALLRPAVSPSRAKATTWKKKYCMKRKRNDAHRLPWSLFRFIVSSTASPSVSDVQIDQSVTEVCTRTGPSRGGRGRTGYAGDVGRLAGEGEAIELVPCEDLIPVLVQRKVLEPEEDDGMRELRDHEQKETALHKED